MQEFGGKANLVWGAKFLSFSEQFGKSHRLMFLQGWEFIDNFKSSQADPHDALEQIQNVAGIFGVPGIRIIEDAAVFVAADLVAFYNPFDR